MGSRRLLSIFNCIITLIFISSIIELVLQWSAPLFSSSEMKLVYIGYITIFLLFQILIIARFRPRRIRWRIILNLFTYIILYPACCLWTALGIFYLYGLCDSQVCNLYNISFDSALAIVANLVLFDLAIIIGLIYRIYRWYQYRRFRRRITILFDDLVIQNSNMNLNLEEFDDSLIYQLDNYQAGLSQLEIEHIHTDQYMTGALGYLGIDDTCAICFEDFADGQTVSTLPGCSHVFHKKCIDEWLRKSPACPLCRKNVREGLPPLQEGNGSDLSYFQFNDVESVMSVQLEVRSEGEPVQNQEPGAGSPMNFNQDLNVTI